MLEHRGYRGRVEVEDDEFYGVVVNLHRDHVDFRGRTIDGVRKAFHESVELYLKGCEEDEEAPEGPSFDRSDGRTRPTLGADRAKHRRILRGPGPSEP